MTQYNVLYKSIKDRDEYIFKCSSCSFEQIQLEHMESGKIISGCFVVPENWSYEVSPKIDLFYCKKCTLVKNIIK